MSDETRQERIHRRLKELGVNRGTASAFAKVLDEETAPRYVSVRTDAKGDGGLGISPDIMCPKCGAQMAMAEGRPMFCPCPECRQHGPGRLDPQRHRGPPSRQEEEE